MNHLVVEDKVQEHFAIESAGTSSWHIGDPPDERSEQTAYERGIMLTSRSSQFHTRDFDRFDYVVAMDNQNRQSLERMAGSETSRQKIHLLRAFDPESNSTDDVPDPYYGGARGFDNVLDICIAGCKGLLGHLREQHDIEG